MALLFIRLCIPSPNILHLLGSTVPFPGAPWQQQALSTGGTTFSWCHHATVIGGLLQRGESPSEVPGSQMNWYFDFGFEVWHWLWIRFCMLRTQTLVWVPSLFLVSFIITNIKAPVCAVRAACWTVALENCPNLPTSTPRPFKHQTEGTVCVCNSDSPSFTPASCRVWTGVQQKWERGCELLSHFSTIFVALYMWTTKWDYEHYKFPSRRDWKRVLLSTHLNH